MPPEKRVAFVVIHGVGPHKPFEAADSFVRGFSDVFQEKHPGIHLHHQLSKRGDSLGQGRPWVESYVRLSLPANEGDIDFYEYFWDIYMVHKVSLNEGLQLLVKASKGAQRFYEEFGQKHPEMRDKAMDLDEMELGQYFRRRRFGRGAVEFRPGGYLQLLRPSSRLLSFFLKILPYLPFAIKVIDWWTKTQLPIISQILRAGVVFIDKFAQNFIGDLVGYLDLDPRSKNYDTRQKIQSGALEELGELMKARDAGNNDQYQQIIVAGHSLGSVIAYDTLNRIIQQTNAGVIPQSQANKVVGLVTFGSPLDKITLFFREYVGQDKEVQRQILANLHGFRALSLVEGKPNINLGTPMQFNLDKTRWLNFYHTRDLASGRLDLYELEKQSFHHSESRGNTRITADLPLAAAHSGYWGKHQGEGRGTNQMYESIIKEFFP